MDPKSTGVDVQFGAKNTIVGRTTDDIQKYGEEGTAYIGKVVMSSGENPVLGRKVLMDVAKPHVVLICGKRGGGKCLDGDTEIVLQDGSLKKIKELEFDSRNILSLNSHMKIQPQEKSAFYKRKVRKMLEVKMSSGKVIRLTHEHPLLTIDGWKPIQELPEGSRIATPRIIPTFGNGFLEESKVKLLAYFLTEGHTKNRTVWFTNSDPVICDDFNASVSEFDPHLTTRKMDKYTLRAVKPGFGSAILKSVREKNGRFAKGMIREKRNTLRTWLIEQGAYGKLAPEKTIPGIVFQLPRPKIGLLLNRMFSCDGSIYFESNRWRISYATSSPKMAEQIHHLLLRFGILSRIRDKMNSYEEDGELFLSKEIVIEGLNAETFIREIGFFGEKEERQKQAMKYFEATLRNPNTDTIPIEVWKMYKPKNWAEIGRRMGYSIPKALRESQFYAPSRQKLLQIARLDENKAIEMLASSDIYWDKIVEKKELEGDFEVYDITVPESHNFIANDIIVHNSYSMATLIEEFARLSPEMKRRVSV
ncbi:MAG: LAGLIDADG family homing endonuclease, partial [archaeon]